MIHAYDEMCLNKAKTTLSAMFDYAVNDCGYDADWFADLFVKTGLAKQFETGNPSVVMGMSGIEIAQKIIFEVYQEDEFTAVSQTVDKSPEYWAGWALAAFQWYGAYRFKDIFERVKMSSVVHMYPLYHEMDIMQFYDAMNKKMTEITLETKLKKIREAKGISQSKLAELSGVGLRSIQMYEQQKNDIDKAQAKTLYRLSRVLGCEIEDLLETPNF